MPTFSSRLREERDRLGLSQQEFAEKCSVTMRSQRNYEKGVRMPDADYLSAAAKFGVNVEYLINGIEFQRRLDKLSNVTKQSDVAGLSKEQRQLLQQFLFQVESGETAWVAKHLLTDDEVNIVNDYRQCSDAGKAAIRATIAALIKDKR